jgi:hypothetical protein
MPKQKDLKRIVRSRMEKTGESYTTARLYVVRKKETPPDYAALAGMSDSAVSKQTGRNWSEWVRALDAVDASTMAHRDIAKYVSSLGVPSWWTQTVTVGYERIRGLRVRGQRRDGSFEANKSRTFAVPVETLFKAFSNARTRSKWLPIKAKVRTASANKTMRLTWPDQTLVQLSFMAKGDWKSMVTVQHEKLRDKATATNLTAWWGERLDALAEILA